MNSYEKYQEKQNDLLEENRLICEQVKEKNDAIVDSVISQFKKRSNVGIKKYGTTLHENNKDDFFQHLKEELMDSILYLEKLQTQNKK